MVRFIPSRAAAVVAVVALVLAVTGTNAYPDGVTTGAVTCEYQVFSNWGTGFAADLVIRNDGPDIDGWTAELTFDAPTTLVGTGWNADMWQPDPFSMSAQNASWNREIRSGWAVAFGWIASAGAADVPATSVNGAPC